MREVIRRILGLIALWETQARRPRWDRIGDRIEDHPMVVGCEDSPVQNEGVAP